MTAWISAKSTQLRAFCVAKWQELAEWALWNAWNYARKREIARRKWIPREFSDIPDADWTPDQRRIRANEARQVLENRHFSEAWSAVAAALEAQALSCDPDASEKARRIVIAKQLLEGVRREFLRKMEDGYMAEVEISEIERKRRPLRFER